MKMSLTLGLAALSLAACASNQDATATSGELETAAETVFEETSEEVAQTGDQLEQQGLQLADQVGTQAASLTGRIEQGIADGTMSLDQLSEQLTSLSQTDLTGVAQQIATTLETKTQAVESLKSQLERVTSTTAVNQLRGSLDTATSTITGLKDQLRVVTDRLRGMGVDVSKFTQLLN
ncbi:MAG: hypothetical protein AAF628_21075 [Planctomycetota bacterium]